MTSYPTPIRNRKSYAASITLSMALALMAFVGSVHAADPDFTINITGTIEPGTCNISSDVANKLVTLQTMNVSDLPASGVATASIAPFQLTLTDCDAGLSSVLFTFHGTPSSDSLRFANTGTAEGVAVELETSPAGVVIGANDTANQQTVQITGGQAVLNLQAGYFRLSGVAAKAGSVISTATFDLTYN